MTGEWTKITPMTLADIIFGKSGAVRYRDLGTTIEVECYYPLKSRTTILTLSQNSYTGFLAWLNGELIQRALPELSSSDRELLLSGMIDEDWPSEEE